jgi:hypothetical protein
VPVLAFLGQALLLRLYGTHAIGEGILRVGLILTFLALFGFIAANLRHTGIRIMALGVMLNFAVIVANGGLMPVSPETMARVSSLQPDSDVLIGDPVPNSKDALIERHDTALWWLSDVLALPGDLPWSRIAFSVGDIFIALGLAFLVLSTLIRVHRTARKGGPA